jgi:hypothetical protein
MYIKHPSLLRACVRKPSGNVRSLRVKNFKPRILEHLRLAIRENDLLPPRRQSLEVRIDRSSEDKLTQRTTMHALGELESLLDSFWLIAVPLFDTSGTVDRYGFITFSNYSRLKSSFISTSMNRGKGIRPPPRR